MRCGCGKGAGGGWEGRAGEGGADLEDPVVGAAPTSGRWSAGLGAGSRSLGGSSREHEVLAPGRGVAGGPGRDRGEVAARGEGVPRGDCTPEVSVRRVRWGGRRLGRESGPPVSLRAPTMSPALARVPHPHVRLSRTSRNAPRCEPTMSWAQCRSRTFWPHTSMPGSAVQRVDNALGVRVRRVRSRAFRSVRGRSPTRWAWEGACSERVSSHVCA
jgi:hypothetical protein